MPFVHGLWTRRPDTLRNLGSEFSDPCPDRLVTHHDASLGEQVLNVAQTKRKAMVSPNRVGNDGTREAMAFQARLGNLADHRQALSAIGNVVNNLTIPGHLFPVPRKNGRVFFRCEHTELCGNTISPCPACGSGFPVRNVAKGLSTCECGEDYRSCPKCDDGWLVERKGRYGRFLSCVKFPRCNGKGKI
jgi:hypothetical protein